MEGDRHTSGLGMAGLVALNSWTTSGFQTSCLVSHSSLTCLPRCGGHGLRAAHAISHACAALAHTEEDGWGWESAGAPSLPALVLVLLLPLPLLLRGQGSSLPLSHHDSVSQPGTLTFRLLRPYAETVSRLGVSREEAAQPARSFCCPPSNPSWGRKPSEE